MLSSADQRQLLDELRDLPAGQIELPKPLQHAILYELTDFHREEAQRILVRKDREARDVRSPLHA